MNRFSLFVFLCLFSVCTYAGGYNVKTSSIISQPGMEVLGEHNGSWYAIVFETPGNLNKPPQYRIFRYSAGFSNCKTSVLYPSFGEKTFYLRAAIINNKVAMFYSRCELRADEQAMMDKREGRAVMSSIERQDFDINTLEPIGDAKVIFDHNDDFFTSSGIDIAQSNDGSKAIVLIKPYYKYQKYKVVITDETTGTEKSSTHTFKELKQYLKFQRVGINNEGLVYMLAKVRDDIITISSDKPKAPYHLFALDANSKMPLVADFNPAEAGAKYTAEPMTAVLNNGEFVLVTDGFSDEARTVFTSETVTKFNAQLSKTGSREVTPSDKLLPAVQQYHTFKGGKEFTNLHTQGILPMQGGNFMWLTEYQSKVESAVKNTPAQMEHSYMITFRFDENLAVKKQNFIHKKQISSTIDYAFSAQAFYKGNDVFLFYNDNWESDEEHSLNLKCTRLPLEGDSETKKVMNTSSDFFISMDDLFVGDNNTVLFQVIHLVDFGDVTKEIKLLEVTVNE